LTAKSKIAGAKSPTRWMALLLGILALLAAACRSSSVSPSAMPFEIGQLLRTTVETRPPAAPGGRSAPGWRDLRQFYRKRLYLPAWSDQRGPLPRADELLRAIEQSAADGLDPLQYQPEDLARSLAALRLAMRRSPLSDPAIERQLVDLDVRLSNAFLTLADQLAEGRLRPKNLPLAWYTKPRPIDARAVLQRVVNERLPVAPALAALAPDADGYQRLRKALELYRGIADRGGWPSVPAGPDLRPGDRGARVAILRARLAISGDLGEGGAGNGLFDSSLATAVARFRARHGLDPGETVDAATLAELNLPVAARVQQLAVNLERWRWLPGDLGRRYILVNVPDYRLRLVDNGRVALAMRVIVGKVQSQTPVFSDRMTRIVFNPVWSIPDSIAAREIAPQLAKDPDYLSRKGMRVVRVVGGGEEESGEGVDHLNSSEVAQLGHAGSPYRLRQPPGAGNALGRVKFLFPNPYDV
jgi:murein L,D-transpeptidase YcbB/YkuD